MKKELFNKKEELIHEGVMDKFLEELLSQDFPSKDLINALRCTDTLEEDGINFIFKSKTDNFHWLEVGSDSIDGYEILQVGSNVMPDNPVFNVSAIENLTREIEGDMFDVVTLEEGELFLTAKNMIEGFRVDSFVDDMEEFLKESVAESRIRMSTFRNMIPILVDVNRDELRERVVGGEEGEEEEAISSVLYTFDIYYDGDSELKIKEVFEPRKAFKESLEEEVDWKEFKLNLLKSNCYQCRRVHLLVDELKLNPFRIDIEAIRKRTFENIEIDTPCSCT